MLRLVIGLFVLGGAVAFGQTESQPGVEVQILLTVADHMNHRPGDLKPEDIRIEEAAVTHWTPYKDGSDLELFVLIDGAADYDLGQKLEELKRFIAARSEDTAVGVGYIHDGTLRITQSPTTDHVLAAAALHPPAGSRTANPYRALSDLISMWPGEQKSPVRREVIFVTSGMDDAAGDSVVCVNAETAIHDAERAGIIVFTLYNPIANWAGNPWSKVNDGVISLAHVSYETGGEAYFVGHEPSQSFAPYLDDIAEHLTHQYLVTLRVSPEAGSGFQRIEILPGTPEQELMKPEEVWVGAPGKK